MRFANKYALILIMGFSMYIGVLLGGLLAEQAKGSPESIWHDTVLKSPYKYRPNLNLSLEYMKTKEYGLCVGYAERAIKIDPLKPTGYLNAASCYIKQKNWVMSYVMHKKLNEIKPNKVSVINLIELSKLMGREKESKYWETQKEKVPELKFEYSDAN